MGRKSIANARFAMTTPVRKGGSEPCMMCHSCKQVMRRKPPGSHLCQHMKSQGSIGVDDVREQINDTIMIRPLQQLLL